MQESVAPPLGQGRYQLTEILGAGGMAVVYKAYDARLDVSRAVKVLNPAMDDHARIRFFNEARTMAKLHHRNLVTVHDVADDGDRTYLVMELVDGGSIADRMAAFGALPPRMACEVTIALLEGLQAAHDKGIVHRDVKPHNVLVGEDGVPKVTDFGIASIGDYSSTKTGAVIGTWAYMSPEQRTDAKTVDARADVFGAGCTLYNMLTGVDPFDLYNTEAYDEKYGPLPEALRASIQQSTRYKAADRFETATEFAAALKAVMADLPDDPEDTPRLGIALAERRAEIVPTMYDAPRSHPTLSERPAAAPVVEDEEEGIPVGLLGGVAVMVLLFLGAGLTAGLLVVAGILVITPNVELSVEEPTEVLTQPVPVEPALLTPPTEPVPAPPEPEPVEPEPAEPESVEPEPVAPEPVVPEPVTPVRDPAPEAAQPRPTPRPRPVEKPEPVAEGGFVRVSTRPPGRIGVVVNHGAQRWVKSGHGERFPINTMIELTFESGSEQQRRTIRVKSDHDVCHDFEKKGPCQ